MRCGLIGKTNAVHRAKQPVTAAVTGEHSASAVGTMRTRCKTQHHDARIGITKASDWFTPIVVVTVRRTFVTSNGLTPAHEAWASFATLNLLA